MAQPLRPSDAAPAFRARWGAPPTLRQGAAVQRAVDALVAALVPPRAVSRALTSPDALVRRRTPRGCILQASAVAVSVSWFPDAITLGALQVTLWQGVVSQPGSAERVGGARVLGETVYTPAELDGGAWGWRGTEGAVRDTPTIVALALTLAGG